METIIIFAICSLVNVMLNTIKTIIMYRNEKISSSLANAITYGFYTIVVVLMAGDLDLWIKVILTAVTNFIGVWLSMLILEKLRKDKLWKVEATVSRENNQDEIFDEELIAKNISFSKIHIFNSNSVLYNIYCPTQADSLIVKEILNKYKVKYFVSETKTL